MSNELGVKGVSFLGLSVELRELINQEGNGNVVVGFADMRGLSDEARCSADGMIFDYGVIICLPFTKEAMIDNNNDFPQKYYSEYKPMNRKRTELRNIAAEFLTNEGYEVLTDTPATIIDETTLSSPLPQKTVGTLSGIGWIGKCAMLVTKEYGSAFRVTVLLTNAPLECGTPITKSLCPANCTICMDVCPGNAVLGGLWKVGVDRDQFFDAHACRSANQARTQALLGLDENCCGLCVSNCPFTKSGLGYN